MKVTVASAFRNSAGRQIDRWARQIADLDFLLDDPVSVLACEGDSWNDTREQLDRVGGRFSSFRLVDVSHGGPLFGSVESPVRMRQLSGVLNTAFSHVPLDCDVLIWVESDLIWDARVLLDLSLYVNLCDKPIVVAPMTMAASSNYDIWGCRLLDGRRTSSLPPFLPADYVDAHSSGQLVEMSSVGSCVAMAGEIARKARIKDENALVGFCADVRAHGWKVYMDPHLKIQHPA